MKRKTMKSGPCVNFLAGVLGFGLGLAAIAGFCSQANFLISETASLPQHYFLQLRHLKPKCYHYTAVFNPWYGQKVIKQILGIDGDRIWYDSKGVLYVNEQMVGIPQTRATDGRRLTSIDAQTIASGLVFLYAKHAQSFDSRYQEFGLVAIAELEGRVIPLL